MLVIELAKYDYIQVAVMLHPSLAIVDDIKVIKASIVVLVYEVGKISPFELLK